MAAILPSGVASLTNWWQGSDLAAAGASDGVAFAGNWTDSISAVNLAQATAGFRPIYRATIAGLNNQPGLDFDGSDDGLAATIANDNQATTWMIVVDDDLSTGNAELIQSSQELGYFNANDKIAIWAGGTNLEAPAASRATGLMVIMPVFNGASSVIYWGNGVAALSSVASGNNPGGNGTGTTLSVGKHTGGSWPPFNGRIVEIARCTAAITGTEAQNLYEGFQAKYVAAAAGGQPTLARSGGVPHMALGHSAVRRRY